MKRTINLLVLVIIAASLFSFTATEIGKYSTKVALIKFKTEVIDYGIINQNSDGTRTFTFTNIGEAPLIISKVKTTCGCTVPSYSKAPILSGEKGEINIKFATNRLGTFSKTITVISNAKGGNKLLKIKGNVVASK